MIKFLLPLLLILTACTTTPPLRDSSEPTALDSKPSVPIKEEQGVILDHKYFTINFNKSHRLSNWVKYTLLKSDLKTAEKATRKNYFKQDPLLVKLRIKTAKDSDYAKSGYAKGHLAPAADFSRSKEAMDSTFIISNVIPQKGNINSGSWQALEKKVRDWACGEEKITVITGPVLKDGLQKLKNTDTSIPQEFFKIVIDETPPNSKAIAFIYNQTALNQSIQNKKNHRPLSEVLRVSNLHLEVTKDSSLADWKSCP